jgi:MFS family permease
MSLFISSIVRNLHWLFLTYSLPFGFANAAIFILGTLICGLYYPAGQHPKHILVMCIISTGFPLGYNIMSAFIFSSIEENGWQSMKRRVGMIGILITCVIGPFFTTKYLPSTSQSYQSSPAILSSDNNRKIYYSKPILYWMLGIFAAMCAVNNFLLHLVSLIKKEKTKSNFVNYIS